MKKTISDYRYVLAMAVSAALTLTAGCANTKPDAKPEEFQQLASEVIEKQDLQKMAFESELTIIVKIDKEYKVFLNKESVGTIADVRPLKEKLAPALERNKRSYRAGTANNNPDVEEEALQRTVFFCAPSTFKYGEVVKVIEAIKAVGGNPIGLDGSGCEGTQ